MKKFSEKTKILFLALLFFGCNGNNTGDNNNTGEPSLSCEEAKAAYEQALENYNKYKQSTGIIKDEEEQKKLAELDKVLQKATTEYEKFAPEGWLKRAFAREEFCKKETK